mgnify:CR=1 FL=1
MIKFLQKIPFYKLINLGLRLGGMGSKFLIVILMSKYLTDFDYGNFGLITTLVTILIYIFGVDFYNYSIRDILKETETEVDTFNKVANTLLFYVLIYIVTCPIFYIIFSQVEFSAPYVLLIFLLGITEHFCQETYRLLIAFKKVLLANILLCIRTVSWVLVLLYKIYSNEDITLDFLFTIWLLANSCIVIFMIIYEAINNYKNLRFFELKFNWIKQGLNTALLFFIGTISLKTIEYANRFIIDYFLGKEATGIFTFYAQIAILITIYINTIVISFELPVLIESSKTKEVIPVYAKFKKSLKQHIVIVLVGIIVLIKPILIWQNKESFEECLPILALLLLGVGLMNYSLAEHFKLYIYNRDKKILRILLITNIISIPLTVFFTWLFELYGAAVAFLITGVILAYLRKSSAKKINFGYD